jgi:hypothetical protein
MTEPFSADLPDAFDMNRKDHELISLEDGGGKTTAIFALLRALKSFQRRAGIANFYHLKNFT